MASSTRILGRIAAALMVASSLAVADAAERGYPPNDVMLKAFEDSDYTYCDAKLVGTNVAASAEYGKIRIGRFLFDDDIAELEDWLKLGRSSARCSWEDTQLTAEDAERLAIFWVIDVQGAKDRAAEHYQNGQSAVVLGALASATKTKPGGPKTKPTKPITEEPPPQERSQ